MTTIASDRVILNSETARMCSGPFSFGAIALTDRDVMRHAGAAIAVHSSTRIPWGVATYPVVCPQGSTRAA